MDSLQTNFFDWAFSDFNSVLTILNLRPEESENFFNVENVVLLDSFPSIYGGKFRGLPGTRFIHDIHKDGDLEEEKEQFSQRYFRRYQRLYQSIKNNETVYFMRWKSEPDLHQLDQFFGALETIKSGHQHILVNVLTKKPETDTSKSPWKDQYKVFNLNDYPFVKEPDEDGGGASQNHLNWKAVFDWIDDHPGKGFEWKLEEKGALVSPHHPCN